MGIEVVASGIGVVFSHNLLLSTRTVHTQPTTFKPVQANRKGKEKETGIEFAGSRSKDREELLGGLDGGGCVVVAGAGKGSETADAGG